MTDYHQNQPYALAGPELPQAKRTIRNIVLTSIGTSVIVGLVGYGMGREHGKVDGYAKGVRDAAPIAVFKDDINKDGIEDLLVTSENGEAYEVFVGTKDGKYESTADIKAEFAKMLGGK